MILDDHEAVSEGFSRASQRVSQVTWKSFQSDDVGLADVANLNIKAHLVDNDISGLIDEPSMDPNLENFLEWNSCALRVIVKVIRFQCFTALLNFVKYSALVVI